MEGFQAKENTSVEGKRKRKARLRFAKKYAKLTAEDWNNCFQMNVLYIFSSTLIQINDIVWGSQECDVPPASQVRGRCGVGWHDGSSAQSRGLKVTHATGPRQTLFSEYYIDQILEKEVKPLTLRR